MGRLTAIIGCAVAIDNMYAYYHQGGQNLNVYAKYITDSVVSMGGQVGGKHGILFSMLNLTCDLATDGFGIDYYIQETKTENEEDKENN